MSSVRKQTSIATLAVAGSRVMGLVREMVFAFFFGAGPVLDAFVAAFRIPNLLRDLFAEGALSNSFVAVFSKKSARDGDDSAWELANRVLTFSALLVGVIVVCGIVFSPFVVNLVASGFAGEKFRYTVFLNRLLFPFIFFVSLSAIAMGMLNTRGKFALPQSASTFFNITSIVVGLATAYFFSPHFTGSMFGYLAGGHKPPVFSWNEIAMAMTGMAVGTLAGGLVQWLVQLPPLFKMGFRPRLLLNLRDPGLVQVLKLTGPAVIGGAAVQINVMVNTNFASYLADGSISWLNYAFRLMQFPIGVFGVAAALAAAPVLARLVATNETGKFRQMLGESLGFALFLCIPSALGLIILADPIISLIYQYGRFTSFDAHQTANALRAYAVGLSFYASIKIYQPAFLAHNSARIPMIVSIASVGVNFFLNWFFVFVLHFAHWGLALGTSGVAICNALVLAALFGKKSPGVWSGEMLKEAGKILASSAVSVLAGWTLYRQIFFVAGNSGLLQKLLNVFPPIAVTVLFYWFFCSRLKVKELEFFSNWLKKKFVA